MAVSPAHERLSLNSPHGFLTPFDLGGRVRWTFANDVLVCRQGTGDWLLAMLFGAAFGPYITFLLFTGRIGGGKPPSAFWATVVYGGLMLFSLIGWATLFQYGFRRVRVVFDFRRGEILFERRYVRWRQCRVDVKELIRVTVGSRSSDSDGETYTTHTVSLQFRDGSQALLMQTKKRETAEAIAAIIRPRLSPSH